MQVQDVNRVPTHVFRLRSKVESSSLFLVIPGNPGMAHFYIPFATKLFQLGKECCDVAVVAHAGHSPGFARTMATQRSSYHNATSGTVGTDNRDWYNLEDQIAHKLAYVRESAEDKDSLYLIGHSIGCYIILQMLKVLNPERVKKVFFLFPGIEKLAITPHGQSMSSLFTTWRMPFTALVWFTSSFPEWFKQFVLNRHFHTTPEPHREHIIRGTMNIDNKSMYNILCMADQEMKEVVTPPFEVIDANIDKMVFYYGKDDHWNVESCYSDMTKRYPGGDVNLCTKGFPHAFVEEHSIEMAKFVYEKMPFNSPGPVN